MIFCRRFLLNSLGPRGELVHVNPGETWQDWPSRTKSFLEAIAQSKGSQCFICAEPREARRKKAAKFLSAEKILVTVVLVYFWWIVDSFVFSYRVTFWVVW